MQYLTRTAAGVSVPKQFCSLGPGPSLLHLALLRARSVAPRARILVTLTAAHRAWWDDLVRCLPADNILVQPEQRGTAVGMLHPLLEILRRDAQASLAILPSDHYFREEAGIAVGLQEAMLLTHQFPERVLLLGFEPADADPDLGYIVPGEACGRGMFGVRGFAEKPDAGRVGALLQAGALLNSFILAANARALLGVFARRWPALVAQVRDYVESSHQPSGRAADVAQRFSELPALDFSSDVLENDGHEFAVLRVAACGWSDLGTPTRLERVLRRHRRAIERAMPATPEMRGQLDLAERNADPGPACDSNASSLRS